MKVEFTNTDGQFNVEEPQVPAGEVWDTSVPAPPPISTTLAQERAEKYAFGLGGLAPDTRTLAQSILNGQEDSVRRAASAETAVARDRRRMNIIAQVAAKSDGPLTSDEQAYILSLKGVEQEGVSPDSVLEILYGRRLMTKAHQSAMMQDVIQTWSDFNPEAVKRSFTEGGDAIAKREIVLKKQQDMAAKLESMSFGQKARSFAWDVVPYAQAYDLHQSDGKLLPGSNLQNRVTKLYMEKPEDFSRKLQEQLNELWDANPSSAKYLLDAMLDYSSDRQFADDAFAVVDVATLGLASKLRKAINIPGKMSPGDMAIARRGAKDVFTERYPAFVRSNSLDRGYLDDLVDNIRRAADAPESAPEIFSQADKVRSILSGRQGVVQGARNEGNDFVQRSPIIHPNEHNPPIAKLRESWNEIAVAQKAIIQAATHGPTVRPEYVYAAAGQTHEAAEIAIKREMRNASKGEPPMDMATFKERLPGVLNGDRIGDNPGSFAREAVTRLSNLIAQKQVTLAQTLASHGKFDRLPEEALQVAFQEASQRMRLEYDAPSSSIRNVYLNRGVSTSTPQGPLPGMTAADVQRFNKDGTIRLYRGEGGPMMGSVKNGGWYTTDLSKAQLYGKVHFIDATKKDMSHFAQGAGGPDEWMTNPSEISHLKRTDLTPDQLAAEGQNGNLSNVNSVTHEYGKKDGTPFDRKAQAEFAAKDSYNFGEGNYKVEQQGAGWVVHVTNPIDETTTGVMNAIVTTQNTAPVSLLNMFMGKFRTSQDTTSYLNREARNITTMGTQKINEAIKDAVQTIGKLDKDEHKNMMRMFDADRSFGQTGRFFETIGDFETEYHHLFKRAPTEKEVNAYFTYRAINDFQYDILNLGLYRDFSRLGVRDHRIKITIPETDTEPKKSTMTPFFQARVIDTLPTGRSGGVHFFNTDGTQHYFRIGSAEHGAIKKTVEDALKDGHKIYQVMNPLVRPLHADTTGHGGDIINFVISKNVSAQPLSRELIPYNPGGHRDYAVQHFIKQAIVSRAGGRYSLEGDVTAFGQWTAAVAKTYAAALNKAADLLKTNKLDELKVFLDKNLPEEFAFGRFQNNFRQYNPNGQWDLDQKFHYVPANKTVLDMDPGMPERYKALGVWSNEVDSPYNLMNQVDRSYIGHRDPQLWSLSTKGTENNPTVTLERAKFLDPLQTMSRATSNSANARLISDYKYQTAASFIEQFGGGMPGRASVLNESIDRLRQNPMYYLLNPPWKKGVDDALLGTARANQAAAINFLNLDSPEVRGFKYLQQKLLDGIFNKFGQKSSDYVAEHMIPTITDPFRYARSMAFHSKLGLFNLPQYFNQAQSIIHSIAVAGPVNGIRGVSAATLMTMLRMTENPKIIDHFASIATKFGWKKADFLESYAELRRSGWHIVQGEAAWIDDVADPKLFRGFFGKVLDAGTVFFKEGEKLSRFTAWNTAFLEWRAKNPGIRFSDKAQAEVLTRADLLNVNMTRASMAPLQKGFGSVMTQFMSYQIRLAEQLGGGVIGAGKQALGFKNNARLTPAETARAIATYSAMYGAPVGIGATFGLWPMHDSIRQAALERNYDVNNPTFKAIVDGIPSWALSMATGKQYNYSQRSGPQGLPVFRDLLNGEKKWWEILGGVSGTTLRDVSRSLDPLLHDMSSIISGKHDYVPLMLQDAADATRNISSLNIGVRAYLAWQYGKWYTRNGNEVMNVDKIDAVVHGFTGLQRQEASDVYHKMDINRVRKEAQKELEALTKVDVKRALEAAAKGDYRTADSHLKRIGVYKKSGNFTEPEWQRVWQNSTQPNMQLKDRIDQDFFYRRAGPSVSDERLKRY